MLLEKLIERQREMGVTDEQFATLLGVSRQLWQFTRTGKQRIGESVIRGVSQQFPDLQGVVLLFLQENANFTSTKG